uniref:Putative peptidase n=1 Tax=viral metagenome TaxID=1070528 RepID=A0A6M3IDW0_9ZZZZ
MNRVTGNKLKQVHIDPTPDADHQASGIISVATVGENVAFGECLYLKSDGKYWRTDADAAATTIGKLAVALATILANAAGPVLEKGYIRDDTWNWTVGSVLYLSGTAGGYTHTQPTNGFARSVGVAVSADVIYFDPEYLDFYNYIVMADGGKIGQDAGPLITFDDSNNYLEITGCNVSIGATAPATKLHVQNGSTGYGWTPTSGTVAIFESSTADRAFITIVGKAAGQSEIWFGDENAENRGRIRYNHVNDSMQFNTLSGGAIWIGSDHNVTMGGIESAPSRLTVESTTDTNLDIVADSDANSADTDAFLRFFIDGVSGTGTQKGFVGYDQGLDDFIIGRGTTTSIAIDANVTLTAATGQIKLYPAANSIGFISGNAAGYLFHVINDGNNADRGGVVIQAGADDASGTTYYLRCSDGNDDPVGYLENISGTFQLVDASDISFKKEIRDTQIDSLSGIKQVRVTDYKWAKIKKDAPWLHGFIAQEVQQVFPDLISKDENGKLGVAITGFVPHLVKALQQADDKIIALESRVASLEKIIKEIQDKL